MVYLARPQARRVPDSSILQTTPALFVGTAPSSSRLWPLHHPVSFAWLLFHLAFASSTSLAVRGFLLPAGAFRPTVAVVAVL